MKKFSLLLAALFCFSIAGCTGTEEGVVESDDAEQQAFEDEYSSDYESSMAAEDE